MEDQLKIPFLRVGTWRHPKYGVVRVTDGDMAKMQENFRAGVLGRPPFVRLGHDRDNASTFGDAPALGWIKELVREGEVLYAVADPTDQAVADAVREKRYRYASAEYDPDYIEKETGRRAGPVLTAVALTNEPYLTRLPEAVVLAEDNSKIYMDFQEVAVLDFEELVKETKESNNIMRKLSDTLKDFVARFKYGPEAPVPSPAPALAEEERRKLADYDRLQKELDEVKERERKALFERRTAEVERKLADLVGQGIPPVMCERARSILLAGQVPGTVKLADGKEAALSDLVYGLLEALPAEHRVKLAQAGAQDSKKPGSASAKELYGDVVPSLKQEKQG